MTEALAGRHGYGYDCATKLWLEYRRMQPYCGCFPASGWSNCKLWCKPWTRDELSPQRKLRALSEARQVHQA